jgi:GntR family transcriptional regulator/MocR family aminotransferase
MLQVFRNKGNPIVPIPVDSEGIQTAFIKSGNEACAVYVTPSHQFPLGGILPAARRATLVRYARENGLYILEDDYDSEFRYSGEPIAPLHAMDPQRVIYIGTFSKSLFPALRIGYVILPEQLHKGWNQLRTHTDVQNPPAEQAALAELLRTRKLDRHVRRMRRLYGQRRQVLLEALSDIFGKHWAAYGDAAGLHVAIDFPGRHFDEIFRLKAREQGIHVTPAERYCLEKGRHSSKLILGYGHLEPQEIREGLQVLYDYMSSAGGCG